MVANVKREILIFLVVGGTTVLIDLISYTTLLWTGVSHDPAKAVGFITGTVFAYFANRIWTFNARHSSLRNILPFCILYASTLAVNVGVNFGVLSLVGKEKVGVLLAFILATGVSAALNFVGMKFFVFGGQNYGFGNSAIAGDSVLQRGEEPSALT